MTPRPIRVTTWSSTPRAQASIVDEQGHVVTNNHVVEGAVAFQVRFADGTVETATLVGTDPFQDVAVLKIDLANGATDTGHSRLG